MPFHPCLSARLFPKEPFPFRGRRHCSHLSPRGGRALPATLLPALSKTPTILMNWNSRKCWAVSGLSSLSQSQERLPNAGSYYAAFDKYMQTSYTILLFFMEVVMAITLRLLDQRDIGRSKTYINTIPLPATRLTVWRAAQMTVRRARKKGYAGTGRYVVLLHKPGQNGRVVRLEKANAVFVEDGSTVTVGVDALRIRKTSDVWNID